jgi:hypothetical protein
MHSIPLRITLAAALLCLAAPMASASIHGAYDPRTGEIEITVDGEPNVACALPPAEVSDVLGPAFLLPADASVGPGCEAEAEASTGVQYLAACPSVWTGPEFHDSVRVDGSCGVTFDLLS